jgi:ribonuclease D
MGMSGALLRRIAAAKALPEATCRRRRGARRRPPPPRPGRAAEGAAAAKAEEHHVAPRLLANSEDLDRLATEAEPDLPALHGWRREVFGEAALALKAGRLAVGVEGAADHVIAVG